jgi:hypothetical protein
MNVDAATLLDHMDMMMILHVIILALVINLFYYSLKIFLKIIYFNIIYIKGWINSNKEYCGGYLRNSIYAIVNSI